MRSHLSFPYNWVECVEPETCERSAHMDVDSATLNSYPLEWIAELLGCSELTQKFIAWRDEEGNLHREIGPAIETQRGMQWCLNGKRHRTGAPAEMNHDGTKEWWTNGSRHRVDGPAIEWASGSFEWWFEGKKHCVSGPAVVHANGQKEWWVNEQRHREDGPAIEWASGNQGWYLYGKPLSENNHALQVKGKKC